MKWKTWIYEQSKANPHPAQTDGSKSVCDRFLKTAKWSLPVFFLFLKKKDKTDKTEPLVQLSGFQIFHLEAAFIWPKHLL